MKNSPQEYAEMLINKYTKIQYMAIEEYIPNSIPVLIECAIIDVTNTTNALVNTNYLPHNIEFYIEVLKILKSKL